MTKWVASGSAYSLKTIKYGVSANKASGTVTPYCIKNPAGGCDTWITVSLGGEWTTEPSQEINWCGPGAGTAVAMHWINSQVVNHGEYTAHTDSGTPFNLYNGQAWMGYFAQGPNGVQPVGQQATSTGALRDGLNSAFAGGYYITLGSGNIPQESNLYGNATYDIGHDGHPMIFLVDASFLQEWSYRSYPVNPLCRGLRVWLLEQR